MSTQAKIDRAFPALKLETIDGGSVTIGRPEGGKWQMVVVYRGLHCPICKKYLGQINAQLDDFKDMDVNVVAVSTDPRDKASKLASELELEIDVAYGLSLDDARGLGLYISTPLSSKETDQPFAEPGLYFIRPDGGLHFCEVSSAPFCRPDLDMIKMGIGHIQKNDYPPRGLG